MAVKLADLIDGAQQASDQVDGDLVSTSTWFLWAKQAVEELWTVVVTQFGDAYFRSQTFTLAGGVSGDRYTLSAIAFRRVIGLDDTDRRVEIRRFNYAERNRDAAVPNHPYVSRYCPRRRYRVMGGVLLVAPFDAAAGNYRLDYVPAPTLPANSTDTTWTLDTELEPWAEFVMLAMARKAIAKEESDTSAVDARLNQLRTDIADAASSRDDGEQKGFADVD